MANAEKERRGFVAATRDDPPLVRVLLAETTRRGETLRSLARQLGVTYERLAQWRRGEGELSNASRSVHDAAARYLGVPTAYVLCMVGVVRAQDFVSATGVSSSERVRRQLEQLQLDPAFAGFFPEKLWTVDPSVQQFVAMLYRELGGSPLKPERPFEWMRTLQLAAAGNLQAQAELGSLRSTDG